MREKVSRRVAASASSAAPVATSGRLIAMPADRDGQPLQVDQRRRAGRSPPGPSRRPASGAPRRLQHLLEPVRDPLDVIGPLGVGPPRAPIASRAGLVRHEADAPPPRTPPGPPAPTTTPAPSARTTRAARFAAGAASSTARPAQRYDCTFDGTEKAPASGSITATATSAVASTSRSRSDRLQRQDEKVLEPAARAAASAAMPLPCPTTTIRARPRIASGERDQQRRVVLHPERARVEEVEPVREAELPREGIVARPRPDLVERPPVLDRRDLRPSPAQASASGRKSSVITTIPSLAPNCRRSIAR